MDKLHMQTADGAADNLQRLAALFPSCVTETLVDGVPTKAIDFDALRTLLGADAVVDDDSERYQFTWPGKRRASQLAGMPIRATLRPCPEESEDFEHTRNLYIEGDNLDVLKCLRETYLGRVKMIYIDPPYNTGGDFVYHDHYAKTKADYLAESGQFDDQGQHLETNPESNGRFHTDWLNMIYPRLRVARDLLSDDGVIFISIDDHEVENLKKLCNEVFGEGNFVAILVWERAYSPKNDAKYISNSHDYIVMYAKLLDSFTIGRLERTEEANARYSNPDNDPRGVWKASDMSVKTYTASCDYPITTPSGKIVEPPAGRCWSLSRNAFLERLKDNRIWFGDDGNSVPSIKRFLSELKYDGMAPTSILFYKDVGHSQEGAKEVVALFGDKGVFDGPKPVRLMQRLINLGNLNKDSIVLDFFSGSASMAHAVIKTNAEKGTASRFIMVQIPEKVSENKKDSGYATICEIGKERIRRAGKKIRQELAARRDKEGPLFAGQDTTELDTGFRVLKLDSTNMEDVFYTPREVEQASLFQQEQNVKPDRTPLDLLFQVMLELGIPLDAHIERATLLDTPIYRVDNRLLVACLEPHVSEAVVEAIAKMQPEYAVVREPQDDATLTNFDELFKTYSPDTQRKTL